MVQNQHKSVLDGGRLDVGHAYIFVKEMNFEYENF